VRQVIQWNKTFSNDASPVEKRLVELSLPLEQKLLKEDLPLKKTLVELKLPSEQRSQKPGFPIEGKKEEVRQVGAGRPMEQQLEPVPTSKQKELKSGLSLEKRQPIAGRPLKQSQLDPGRQKEIGQHVEQKRGKKMAAIDLEDLAAAEGRQTTTPGSSVTSRGKVGI